MKGLGFRDLFRSKRLKHACAIFLVIISICCVQDLYGDEPGAQMKVPVDKGRMRHDVEVLTTIHPPRSAKHVSSLDKSAEYILAEFAKTGCNVSVQSFTHDQKVYKNVICTFGPQDGERVVVGAHYDVYGDQPGADDNASGVAGLIELARLVNIQKPDLRYRTDFVAFTLEEPQFFRTRHMGSYIFAQSLYDTDVHIRAMIALEMIGYFSDKPRSQRYPVFFLKWFYPDKGNYIAVVGKWGQGSLVAQVKKSIMETCRLDVEDLTAPAVLPGIDFSDHQSFWRFGYKAVMITDTAFYRNRNYHSAADTIDTLDFDKMSEVVKGVYRAVINLSR
ncbi:MAG: Peptidase family M28 [Syntrophorhabdus sp. PtaU1.Bin058]|nr:MAG: Peptidase family M28 [Syntrophorhabdus sp. PtaU1.Bin058]